MVKTISAIAAQPGRVLYGFYIFALILGVLALAFGQRTEPSWFAIPQHFSSPYPEVLPAMGDGALLMSVLAILGVFFLLTWWRSGSVSFASYGPQLQAMAFGVSFIAVELALWKFGLGWLSVAIAVASLAIGSWLIRRALPLPSIYYYVAVPLFVGMGSMLALSVLVVFGVGALAGLIAMDPTLSRSFGVVHEGLNFAPERWLIPATAGLIAAFIIRKAAKRIRPGHLISDPEDIRRLGAARYARLAQFSRMVGGLNARLFFFAAMVVTAYAIVTPSGADLGWWRPGYFIVLLLLVVAAVITFLAANFSGVMRKLRTIHYAMRTRTFWRQSHDILSRVPQPKDPKGYVFFSTQNDTYTLASLLMVIIRLKQLGWALVVIDNWPFHAERTGDDTVDRFFAIELGRQDSLNFDWTIDWKKGQVEAAGMNFYHPIWEALSRHFGRYTVDMPPNSDVERIFIELLKVADSTLHQAFRIANSVAGNGKPVRVVGASGQFVPNAVWNIFCRERGKDRDMHFVWVQQGYQTYYADKARLSKRITLDNMTRKWPYSNPYLPAKVDFDAWVARGQDVKKITERALTWTKSNRATDRATMSASARSAMDRIVAHKQSGRPVVVVLGKMVFDLSTPYERGPAHDGMFDWLNHTVDVARRNPNILYLIKPHPYESRPEIAGRVAQYFTDMIEQVVPDNVVILGHSWFNLHTLFALVDLGVLWNGTSGLELGLHGIPCIICSDWGPIDYPVGLLHPTDRADYERMLSDPRSLTLPEGFVERCALLLEYTASDELMIPYDYAARPLTNEPFGPPYWYMDQVERFFREGDPNIDRAAERFI